MIPDIRVVVVLVENAVFHRIATLIWTVKILPPLSLEMLPVFWMDAPFPPISSRFHLFWKKSNNVNKPPGSEHIIRLDVPVKDLGMDGFGRKLETLVTSSEFLYFR